MSQTIKCIRIATLLLLICACSFYLGYTSANAGKEQTSSSHCLDGDTEQLQQRIISRVQEEVGRQPGPFFPAESKKANNIGFPTKKSETFFPSTAKKFAVDALRVSRKELMSFLDFGVPTKPAEDADVMIIYNSQSSLPKESALDQERSNDGKISRTTVHNALGQCDTLNILFTPYGSSNIGECYVAIGDFESYHINRWMRMPEFTSSNKKERALDHKLPLRHVGRITLPKGVDELDAPQLWSNFRENKKGFVLQHFDALKIFLENVDLVLKDLKKLLKERKVVKNNTVIVMTVNKGQSELLSNFVCNSRSKGFDLGNVLVFPTDEESKILAEGLGVTTYYDEKSLGRLPSGEAKFYGDPIFASMMYAKILCVVYVSLLGHDVLFQDVDLVWYKDPLSYFHDDSNVAIQKFDILFQHDGSAQPRYNPLSANSGFYYVRAHKRTQYMFTSLLYHGGLVRYSKSHQQVLVQILLEHASMFGLNVKVFDKIETDLFPGGFHYHRDWKTMHEIIRGESNAYILHMSWTENKSNKLLFFRQLGEWYVRDECSGGEFLSNKLSEGKVFLEGSLLDQCCSADAIYSCHYKDKPSKHPCPDSPSIDNKAKLFWET